MFFSQMAKFSGSPRPACGGTRDDGPGGRIYRHTDDEKVMTASVVSVVAAPPPASHDGPVKKLTRTLPTSPSSLSYRMKPGFSFADHEQSPKK